MIFHVMTLFPNLIEAYMKESIMKRASEGGTISVRTWNIRDFSANKHKKADDYPYGGGAGMLMTPQPIMDCYRHIMAQTDRNQNEDKKQVRVIYLSPKGERLNQRKVVELSQEKELILLCGHYEGIDQRVIDRIVTDEISIGDYVLTGGELPALTVIDAVSRYVSGVLGTQESLSEESFSQGLLEYPQYTRPVVYEGDHVPKVLLSGDHQKIERWRRYQSIRLTKKKRPDLLISTNLSEEELLMIKEYEQEEQKMKRKYEVIFFDADDTLLDFGKSEGEALRKTMEDYGTVCEDRHLSSYHAINRSIWQELEQGSITQEELKVERFRRFLTSSGLTLDARDFGERYLDHLSTMAFLMDGAKEILVELQKEYRLAMITNGIARVQKGRLSKSGIGRFFEEVIISEEVGFSKPSGEIFEYAMRKMGLEDRSKALMVGDSLTSDMAGATAFGMDTCWLNLKRKNRPQSPSPTYEIFSLYELKKLL